MKSVRGATCRQKPFQLRAPQSGKFRDFLKTARGKVEAGPVSFQHKDWKGALAIRVYDESALDPVDPLTIKLSEGKIEFYDYRVLLGDVAERIAEFKEMCELVGEEPVVLIDATQDVTFDEGLQILTLIAKAGFDEISIPPKRAPHGPGRGPHGPIPTSKPVPPPELFPKK